MRAGEWLIAVAILCGVGIATWMAWPFTVDDAWIIARIAQNIAEGNGYAFNAGQPSDGVTGPLWLLPLVLAQWAHLPPVVVAKAAGLLCTLIAIVVALRWGLAHSLSRQGMWIGLGAIVVQGNVWIWSVSGLETGAATLCVTVAMTSALWPGAVRTWPLAIAVLSVPWLRPEALVIAGVAVTITLVRRPLKGVIALTGIVIGAITVCIFRGVMFEHWLPLSVYAKPASSWYAVQYVWLGILILTSGFGAVLVAGLAVRGEPPFRLVAVGIAAHLLAIMLGGGDWMPGFRLLVPVLPLYGLLVGAGWEKLHHKHLAVAYTLVTLIAVVPTLDSVVQLPRVHEAGRLQRIRGPMLGDWLQDHVKSAALVDVGLVGFKRPLELIDLVGLTDETIAFSRGLYLAKRIDVAYLALRRPDAIVLRLGAWNPNWGWGVPPDAFQSFTEAWLFAEPWVRRHYRLAKVITYTYRYHYLVLLKRDEPQAIAALAID